MKFVFKCQVITSTVILGHDNHEFLSEAVPAAAEGTPLLPGGAGRASVPSVQPSAVPCPVCPPWFIVVLKLVLYA